MKNAIRNQLLITYVVLTIIPVMVISIYIVNTYSRSMIEVEQTVLERGYEQIITNLDSQMTSYRNTIGFIKKDHQLLTSKLLKRDTDSIRILLQGYQRTLSHVLSITVFSDDGNFVSSDSNGLLKADVYESDVFEQMKDLDGDYYLTSFSPGEGPIISANSEYIDTVHFFLRLGDDKYVDIMISSIMFEDVVKNVDLGDGGYFYVMSKTDGLVYSPVASTQLSKVNDPGYLTKHEVVDGTNWEFHMVKPIVALLERINRLRNNLILLFILTIFILLLITFVFANYIVNPIKKLQQLMRQVEKGNLDVRYEDNISNELHDLGLGFNKMIDKIRSLIRQVKKEQQAKKATEIAMLQSNIKPHFLYNTLETIRWMSKKYKADDISDTVNALATFFRVGLSKGKETITLKDEIAHVTSYLQIQKLRYEDILDYSIDVSPSHENLMVPKLILQPFVENALYHGIKESGEEGTIQIESALDEQNGFLKLTVSDNGQGMDRDRLNKVLDEMDNISEKSYVSYGIKNVHHRIKLLYGDDYGVSIDSTQTKGTTVTLKLPLI